MARPRKCRLVETGPKVDFFKPRGVPLRELAEVTLSVEGMEALRLAELEGLEQEEAARRMNISRQTFGRVLSSARRAVAQAVVLGQALRIEGGDYAVRYDQPWPQPEQSGPGADKESKMAKIAISSEGPTLDDLVDPRFGRAGGFVLVDLDTMQTSYLDNGISQARSQGAGIQAAQVVAQAGATVVLTGYVGPKAFQALQAVGVQVGQDLENITVRQALERYQAGQVTMAQAPNREAGRP